MHDPEAAVGNPQHRDQDEQVKLVRAQRRACLRRRRDGRTDDELMTEKNVAASLSRSRNKPTNNRN